MFAILLDGCTINKLLKKIHIYGIINYLVNTYLKKLYKTLSTVYDLALLLQICILILE